MQRECAEAYGRVPTQGRREECFSRQFLTSDVRGWLVQLLVLTLIAMGFTLYKKRHEARRFAISFLNTEFVGVLEVRRPWHIACRSRQATVCVACSCARNFGTLQVLPLPPQLGCACDTLLVARANHDPSPEQRCLQPISMIRILRMRRAGDSGTHVSGRLRQHCSAPRSA